jgi:hypothetical protein
MKWLKKRLAEPSTYIGLSLLMQGIGTLGKMDHTAVIADAIQTAGASLAHGDYTTGAALLVGGILGIFMKEKGKADHE